MYPKSSQNLSHHLWLRELNIYPGIRHPIPSHFLYHERNIYKSITPRLTVQNVWKPIGYLRKFTPDGRMLLAFSHDQKSLDVYEYQGVSSAAKLLRLQENECIDSEDDSFVCRDIKQKLFDVLFKRKFHIPLITTPTIITRHFLNREFSLFLDNGNYVLLASTAGGSIFPSYLAYRLYTDLYDDTELYDYTFYLIDLRKGIITDTLRLEHDFVLLSHNHSVSLYDRTLAILSTYRQCIELFELNVSEGKLKRLFTIGPYGSDLDRDRVLAHQQNINYDFDPDHTFPLSHLKQKILSFMYQDIIMSSNCMHERREKLGEFYKKFSQIESMIILKMQLIDNDHILFRYENRQTQRPMEMTIGVIDPFNKNFKFYVFYNITEQKILKIYPQDSKDLVQIVRNYSDEFRNVRSLQIPWHASSPSNNYFFRSAFDQAFESFPGGLAAAAARFNSTLPISSQSFSTSPYLDYSLFKYDDRYVSTLERPRLNSFEPIRFYDRKTGKLLYRAYLEEQCDDEFELIPHPRELVTFIFHPYEPFFISLQKCLSRYVMNFHLYNSFSKVEV